MDRAEVLERLAPLRRLRPIEVAPAGGRVEATEEGLVIRPSGRSRPLTITAEATPKVLTFAGLAPKTADNLSRKTLGAAATELLAARGRYVLLTQDGEVVDITPPGAIVPVEPERVVRAIERALPNDLEYTRVLTPNGHTAQVEIAAGEPLMVNDLVRGGAMVSFSALGVTAPEVRSYVVRLVCTNGLTTMDLVRSFKYGGDGEDLYGFLRGSIREAYRAVAGIVERFRAMAGREITPEERAHVIEGLLQRAGIRDRATAMAVHGAAETDPPENEWEAYNLITWATSHVIAEPSRVMRAQRALAPVASQEAPSLRVCPSCGHAH